MLNHPTKGDVISDMKKVCKDKAFAFSQKYLREVTPRSADWISSDQHIFCRYWRYIFITKKKQIDNTFIRIKL